MEICGNICVDKANDVFMLQCSHCAKEVEIILWQEFVTHFKTLHKSSEELWLDQSQTEIKDELDITDCLEENVFIDIPNEDEKSEDETADSQTTSQSNISDLEHNATSEDAISDAESISKDEPTTKFNPSFHRRNPRTDMFIELYKKLTCLWNPTDANHENQHARTSAIQKLISDMRKRCNVILNENSVNAAIKRLHTQYNALYDMKKKSDQKIWAVALEHFEKCSFLAAAVDNREHDSDNEMDKSTFLELTKVNKNTTSFINAYSSLPQLYDSNHRDYKNHTVRKQAYETLAESLKNDNINLDTVEIYCTIKQLRVWYYRTSERVKDDLSDISVGQQFYLDKCNFMPPKMLQQKLPCEKCGKIFFSDMTLQLHLYKDHKIGELPYKCSQCERSFEQKSQLTIHQQRTHIGKVYQCEYCEKKFSVHSDMKKHMTHHTDKSYVCELCGKAFRLKHQLGYHVNAIHTKNRAFKCTMCPKDFLKNCDLKDHIKAHLNIRDKICQTCGKGFTNCHSLIRHRQIHAEVKKFACKLCDAKFFQFVGLNSHLKRTHNIVKNKTLE